MFRNKSILITGGTGSFGKMIAAELLNYNFKRIIIYSRDEEKQWVMKNLEGFNKFEYIIGDVRDYERVKQACRDVNIIFHAAALKQVPDCENHPEEAIKTNILGSINICRAAYECMIEMAIGLSTDKSVGAINSMGITKAMMEKVFCSKNRNFQTPIFCCTRYGNVMNSRGSVIPLFIDQIKKNLPITITEPKMTRFLMSLKDSVSLVLYALQNAKGGEIFVKKAPAVTIGFLAESIKKYFNSNSEIKVVGIRPGEKIHETLVNEYEYNRVKNNGDYFIISPEYKEFDSKIEGEYRSNNGYMIEEYEELIKLLKVANIL